LGRNEITNITPLSSLAKLSELYLYENQITDISSLSLLPNLKIINLNNNQISNIYPLVENEHLKAGDRIDLRNNPLSAESINIYIPQLIDRGIDLLY
jgi:Leucine-rich repeat (LRR) protein